LVVLVFLNVLLASRSGAEDVCGNITQDTTWSLNESPYVVTCDVTVDPSAILSINPGVIVKFAAFYLFTVNGTLNAQGTAEQMITFTSGRTPQKLGDWSEIYLTNLSGHSIFKYVRLEYSNNGLHAHTVSPTIEGSIFENNTYGIYLENGSDPVMKNNNTKNNLEQGIIIW